MRMTNIDYLKNPNHCQECGKPIEFKKSYSFSKKRKFCSSSCAAKSTNSKREVHTSKYGFRSLGSCLNCGNPNNRKDAIYCSNKCQMEYKTKQMLSDWKERKRTFSSKDTSKVIRDYLFEKHDNKCSVCGWSEINPSTGKIPLQVHHVDGDYKNNKEENLQLLCPNCHSLTPTFMALNKGKGRGKK